MAGIHTARAGSWRPSAAAVVSDSVSAISNIIARWRADQITNLTTGAAITTWPDLSVNGYTATAGTASPTWITGALGGQPVARFNGTSQYLTANANSGDPAQTVVAVISTAGTGSRTIRGGDGSAALQVRIESTNNVGMVAQTVANIASGTTPITLATPALAVASYNTSGGAWSIYVNGAAAGSGTNVQGVTTRLTSIGRNGANNGEYYSGDIAELIVWNRVLNGTELATVNTYVTGRYGIATP